MFPGKSLLIDSALVLALILAGVVGYKLSPVVMPKADWTITPSPACDLHQGPCAVPLPGGGQLQLNLTPHPIPTAAPITLEAVLTDARADTLAIDFAGADMNMGFNRPVLQATEDGRFTGQATLPVCVTGRMTWQATALLERNGQRLAIPFRFETDH